jgi:hypothetical protein
MLLGKRLPYPIQPKFSWILCRKFVLGDAFLDLETFWPPGSPDLRAPDALKAYIFQISPAALQELRKRIRKETAAISREELEMAIA